VSTELPADRHLEHAGAAALSFTPEKLIQALRASLDAITVVSPESCGDPSGQPGLIAPRLCIALSGGLDSTVLLVALAKSQRDAGAAGLESPVPRDILARSSLRAIHVDHGLHARSAEWSESCRRLAAAWSIPFESVQVSASATAGESPEAAARVARYGALRARLEAGEVLLTAHHADDQLETVLLQWLRGGGLRALAGMPRIARFGSSAWHARPLLPFTRAELLEWGERQHLQWQEDPSNIDTRFDRNYLRLEVLPALRRRWPAAARTIGRVAEHARDGIESEDALAERDLAGIKVGSALDVPSLLALTAARQRGVLRAWLRGLALPLPSAQSLAALRHDIGAAAADRNPKVDWPGVVVHRYRNRLYALPRSSVMPRTGVWVAPDKARFDLTDTTALELVADLGVGLSRSRLPATLRVETRSSGESFTPAGSAHRRQLRKWLQEHDVLPWRRTEVPLLFADHYLVAVGDLGICAEFAALPDEPSWRVVWHGRGIVTESDALRFNWRGDPPSR
jgi:tRNA(Ile)-lysidine synthase